MMLKKLLSPISMMALLVGLSFLVSSCNLHDEDVLNDTAPSLAAFGTTIHQDSTAICGTATNGIFVNLYNQAQDPNSSSGLYGTWEMVATNSGNAVFSYELGRGWFLSTCSIFLGSGQSVPADGKGGIEPSLFPYQESLTLPRNIGEMLIPITSLVECPNDNRLFAILEVMELDWLGSPFNFTPVTVQGQPYGNDGSQYVAWCAEPCQSLTPPPCVVPTPGPGDDLSAYACGNNNDKITVCHLPPGNPANMQEICISESALPAHVIDFKPSSNPCMGHHSGCHIGPCDPCGPGSTALYAGSVVTNCPGN